MAGTSPASLHSGLLLRHRIAGLQDLARLPDVVCHKHLQFVDFDWIKLVDYLRNKMGRRCEGVIAGARRRNVSILRLQQYLRRKGVFNTHRFLVPRAINDDVRRALNRWTRKFDNGE